MRGKHGFDNPQKEVDRITPADAGKTCTAGAQSANPTDHPRGCGENVVLIEATKGAPWITPADAGKTRAVLPRLGRDRDHPRGCGENDSIVQREKVFSASPPRMRGKRLCS